LWEKGGLQKRLATLQKKQKIVQLLARDRRHEHWYKRWQMPARPNKKNRYKNRKFTASLQILSHGFSNNTNYTFLFFNFVIKFLRYYHTKGLAR
jgi:hypothetical protein